MNPKRVESARVWGRALMAIAVLLVVPAGFQFVAAPPWTEPMFGWQPPTVGGIPMSLFTSGIGLGGMLFGLAWMWRIYRAPTNYESARWRYRDRD